MKKKTYIFRYKHKNTHFLWRKKFLKERGPIYYG